MDSHAYFMKEAASSLDISGGTGPQCPLVPPPMSNSAVLRGKVSRCKSATEFPSCGNISYSYRKCGRCVKIERQSPRKNCRRDRISGRATEFPATPAHRKIENPKILIGEKLGGSIEPPEPPLDPPLHLVQP